MKAGRHCLPLEISEATIQGRGAMFEDEFKKFRASLPSAEHHRHIRRFQGLDWMSDEEDWWVRGYVSWRRLEHNLHLEQQAKQRAAQRRYTRLLLARTADKKAARTKRRRKHK